MSGFIENVQPALTIENAQAWKQDDEKFLFVAYLLESFNIQWTRRRVEYVEDKFEEILAA